MAAARRRTVLALVAAVLAAVAAGGLVATRPAGAVPRRITHLKPDALDILRSPGKFQRSSRRHVIVRPDRLDLMRGPAVLERLAFPGRAGASLADVVEALNRGRHRGWIEETAPGTFLLRVSLVQAPGSVLSFARPAVRQVRLLDDPEVYLSAMGATGRFAGVTVTSWDPRRGGPATDPATPRPFVEYAEGSDLRIDRSTFAYLGSDRSSAYGVNWRRSTGAATGSTFAHNFFGAYTYQARGVVFRGNVFRDNAVYGLDPHTGSTRLVVEDNRAFGNRVHGIVFSEDVTDGVVRGNHAYANGDNGIVLDERSDRNTVSGNLVEGNGRDGIVVIGSSGNLVRANLVRRNRVGIRVNLRSGANRVQGNELSGNRIGVELYGGAYASRLRGNHVERAGQGIVVTERGIAAIDDVTVRAVTAGLDIRPGALVRLRTSSIESPSPLAGSPPRATLANRLVAPAGPVRWLAVVGVAYLAVAVLLQVVHKSRNRVGRKLREVPQGVAKW
jgi:parallel beta-helix repeat protein